jgi:hypothetical protein
MNCLIVTLLNLSLAVGLDLGSVMEYIYLSLI